MFYYGVLSEFPTIVLASSFPPTFWLQHPYTRILGGHLIQPLRVTDQKIEAQRDKVIFPVSEQSLELEVPVGLFLFQFSLPSPLYQPTKKLRRHGASKSHLYLLY